MKNEVTLEQLRKMKLTGMYRAFKTVLETQSLTNLTTDELISMLVEQEWDDRQNRMIERSLRNAKFRYKTNFEQITFTENRGLDRNQINRLMSCDYIKKAENVIITGSTGTGKSFLGSALGNQACLAGYKVFYASTNRLFTQIKMAKADGSSLKELSRLEKTDLIILDDFGIQPFDNQSRLILMEMIEDRHGKKSTVFTTQVPVPSWFEIIGDETIADAILDRVVHDAHRIELKGDSLRKKGALKFEQ
jgi:DNA replication protein DnaC